MKKLLFAIILLLLTACSNGSSSNPADPGADPGGKDPSLDYSAIKITYLELFYDTARVRSKYYLLATIENKSGQTFTDLYFDGTGEFDETDDLFNLGPYEVINIDSSDFQGFGTMPPGTYETLFFITPFLDFDNIITSKYASIIIN